MTKLTEFNELQRVKQLAIDYPQWIRIRNQGEVNCQGQSFPVPSIHLGSDDVTLPVYCITSGVHGLERIGVELCLYFLRSTCEQLQWDTDLQARLKKCRIVALPLVNPYGVFRETRSNGHGIDLMRNAPIEAEGKVPWLAGGHRISDKLPWFRGFAGHPMETESQILINFIQKELFPSQTAIALDLHSGFGFRDRLWYPYSTSLRDFPRIREAKKMAGVFTKNYSNHIYHIEATAQSYRIHGDLWDYLVNLQEKLHPNRVFVPWTLELGSWMWIRKNPFQFFRSLGIFNPLTPHRHRRVMRRHQILLDFFWRAAAHPQVWCE